MLPSQVFPKLFFISSKEVLEKTGITRVTLHNYIKLGIIPSPIIGPPRDGKAKTRKIGYFPSDVIETISLIKKYKKDGYSLGMIAQKLSEDGLKKKFIDSDQHNTNGKEGTNQLKVINNGQEKRDPFSEKQINPLPFNKLPAFCSLVIIVAELHNAAKFLSQLHPSEFFELISQVWSAVAVSFEKCHGRSGKQVGDGIVSYFLAEPQESYRHILSAVRCVFEIRKKIADIDAEWKVRKKWDDTLRVNIGIHEGREWVGHIPPINQIVALGDTAKIAGLLSDFACEGSLWVSKHMLSLLPPEFQKGLVFGIRRPSPEGEMFIANTFSRIMDLIDLDHPENIRFMDIGTLSAAELIQADQKLLKEAERF